MIGKYSGVWLCGTAPWWLLYLKIALLKVGTLKTNTQYQYQYLQKVEVNTQYQYQYLQMAEVNTQYQYQYWVWGQYLNTNTRYC